MKRVTFILALTGFLFMSCNAQTSSNKGSNKTEETMKTIHLTKADFLTKVANFVTHPQEWIYLGDKPALIDFYADWCAPCRAIAPVLEELAAEYDGEIYVYKIDTEAEQELAAAFGIRSIPSLLFVPMRENPQMAQGAIPKPQLKEAIDKLLLGK
ncbi:MAG: thioredoxin [Tannerellaceae bacterium]|jgi:thioredoxin|nr:thioredoxin [Tannerellaceae bacterium]